MPAKSQAQKDFFSLVKAVKKGEVPASKVTSNVRTAAHDTSSADVDDMVTTKSKGLPDKVDMPADSDAQEPAQEPEETQEESISFGDIVGQYNEYGKLLQREHTLAELAQQLSGIAEYAEYTLTNEMDDWFDAHTIRRNVKEMSGYAKEFSKIATEADAYNQRMTALYDDMGRVLERYFDIMDQDQPNIQPGQISTNEFTHEPDPDAKKMIEDDVDGEAIKYPKAAQSPRPNIEKQKRMPSPSSSGFEKRAADNKSSQSRRMNREGAIQKLRELFTNRSVAYMRERLNGDQLARYDTLPEEIQVRVAFRSLR